MKAATRKDSARHCAKRFCVKYIIAAIICAGAVLCCVRPPAAAKGPVTMQFPNIWGDGGALFAYSGMDGRTDWHNPLVGSTLDNARGFIFHTESKPVVKFGVRLGDKDYAGGESAAFTAVADEIVAGGLIVSNITAGDARVRLEYVFVSKDVLAARVTAAAVAGPVDVFLESAVKDVQSVESGNAVLQSAKPDYFALDCKGPSARKSASEGRVYATLSQPGESAVFVWAYSSQGGEEAAKLATDALVADLDGLIKKQVDFFSSVPEPPVSDEIQARTYYKAASVLKVNCYSPQDRIPFKWTTPDRWPHRNMWIWDSAFHAIALRYFAPDWAEDAIKAVLVVQRENGFIPHMITPDGSKDSDMIQPPILAWAGWKVYEKTRNLDYLEYIYPRIGKMIEYDRTALDADGNGLSAWETGAASGMDNSPRFDQPTRDSVDLNAYIVNDMRYLARIARELKKEDEAALWDKQADEHAARVDAVMWDKASKFYYDTAPDGSLITIKTAAGFTPMFAGICDKERAAALVEHLTNPAEFWRPFPLASVAADEPTFSDNMWRGPVWINYNYFLIEALRLYGYDAIADDLRARTIREIARWYEADGLIYEYYDSEAKTDPVFLHRKALGGPKAKKAAAELGTTICDYNWTAALYMDLLMSER